MKRSSRECGAKTCKQACRCLDTNEQTQATMKDDAKVMTSRTAHTSNDMRHRTKAW